MGDLKIKVCISVSDHIALPFDDIDFLFVTLTFSFESLCLTCRHHPHKFQGVEFLMRLFTWNAGRGKYAKKAPVLTSMGADIAVIPEIAKPELINEHCLWFGTSPNQGIAITSSLSYTLTPLPE